MLYIEVEKDKNYLTIFKKAVINDFKGYLTSVKQDAIEAYNAYLAGNGKANIVPTLDLTHKITSDINKVQHHIELTKPAPVCARCEASDSVLIRYALGYEHYRHLFTAGEY